MNPNRQLYRSVSIGLIKKLSSFLSGIYFSFFLPMIAGLNSSGFMHSSAYTSLSLLSFLLFGFFELFSKLNLWHLFSECIQFLIAGWSVA